MTAALVAPTPPTGGVDGRMLKDIPPPTTPILREWSYPPSTPVAVAVSSNDPGPPPTPPPPPQHPPGGAGSPLLALQNACLEQLGQSQVQYPVVATLVTNTLCNLRSSIDHIYAGIADPIDVNDDDVDDDGATSEEKGVTYPAGAEEDPAEPPSAAGPEGSCWEEGQFTGVGGVPVARDRLASSDSVQSDSSWIVDAFNDRTEFHVLNGKLVEVTVPVPSIEDDMAYDEAYDEAILRHRGRHCRRMSSEGGRGALRRNVGRVRRWVKRRREAAREEREHKRRERKNSRELGKKDLAGLEQHQGQHHPTQGSNEGPAASPGSQETTSTNKKRRKNKTRGRGAHRCNATMNMPPPPPRSPQDELLPGPPAAPAAVVHCIARMGSAMEAASPLIEPAVTQVARFIGHYYQTHAGRYLTATAAEGGPGPGCFLPSQALPAAVTAVADVRDQVLNSAASFHDAIADKIAKNDALVSGDKGRRCEEEVQNNKVVSSAEDGPKGADDAKEQASHTSALNEDEDITEDKFEEEEGDAAISSEVPCESGIARDNEEQVRAVSEKEGRTAAAEDSANNDAFIAEERMSVKGRVEEIEAHRPAAALSVPSTYTAGTRAVVSAKDLPSPLEDCTDATTVASTDSESQDLEKEQQAAAAGEASFEDVAAEVGPSSLGRAEAPPPPLSEVERDDGTTLKVVFVGAPEVDKSSIVDALTGSTGADRAQATRRRSSGVVVRNWDPRRVDAESTANFVTDHSPTSSSTGPQDKNVKFTVWDVPAGNPGGVDHHATPSVFFSPNSLYVLVWDMGATNGKTRRRRRKYSDEFETESANRKADRALERDIDDRVLFWVDCIEKAGGEGSVILPIASSCGADPERPEDSDEEEAQRRCDVMKNRLLRHYDNSRRTSAEPLPQLVFDGEGRRNPNDSSVLRVDATKSQGFDQLRVALMAIGSTISDGVGEHPNASPGVFTEVKNAVKDLKAQDNKVVPLDLIVSTVKDALCTEDEDGEDIKIAVMKCLQLLSSSGELIYHGGKSPNFHQSRAIFTDARKDKKDTVETFDDLLAEFVVLSPKWLLSAVSCVLRRDLKQEIIETRSFMNSQGMMYTKEQFADELSCSFFHERSNCPIITSTDASMLWQSMAFMRDASDRVIRSARSSHSPVLFEYMKQLLIHRGVFVPISVVAPSALLGGEHRSLWIDSSKKATSTCPRQSKGSTFFLIPSLIAPETPQDVWTYKSTESWRSIICHSWLFEDGAHPGMLEQLTASVLQDVFNYSSACSESTNNPMDLSIFPCSRKSHLDDAMHDFGNIRVHQVFLWKHAFLLKLGMDDESTVEIFGHLVGNDSHLSVASEFMGSNMKRLVVSAKGQVGGGGRKIWRGGYGLVLKSLEKALEERLGLALEREAVCHDCLQTRRPSMANTWKTDFLKAFARRGQGHIRCSHGHHVDANLLCGLGKPGRSLEHDHEVVVHHPTVTVKPVGSLLRGVVMVGLWDSETEQIKNVGSGFVADKDKGLIVTASHVLFEMHKKKGFGKPYYGLDHGKAVIGVIPESETNEGSATAVFRYFAEIVAHDVRNVDACILRITTKFESDIGGQGEGCGDQPEIPILHDPKAMKAEELQQLKLTKRCELEDSVRILGFNQGGEGRLQPGRHINRCADFAKGYVCGRFKAPLETPAKVQIQQPANEREIGGCKGSKPQFAPSEEIIVRVPTINGHSGGPCVNQEGNVIGILSRADLADAQRCYLVPAAELRRLLKKARSSCMLSPLELYYLTT